MNELTETEETPVTALTVLETLQTVLSLLKDASSEAHEYVLSEMKDFAGQDMPGSAEQYELVKRVMESDHVQAGW